MLQMCSIDDKGLNPLDSSEYKTRAETIMLIERPSTLSIQNRRPKCVLVIVADGFKETETIAMLSLLRQAGLCVKSVGLTSGLVGSAHGVQLKPDLTLADLDRLADTYFFSAVILPTGIESLSRLEADPRVHRLLRQVMVQRGQIATSHEGLSVLRLAAVWDNEPEEPGDPQEMPVLLRAPGQPLEAFAQDLVWRLSGSDSAQSRAIG